MPPRLGLYSLANTPEKLLSQGYGMVGTEFAEDPAFGTLAYNTVYNPAPYTGDFPFQNVFRINEGQYYGDLDSPSFGGVSGYRDTGGMMGIDVAPTSLGFDTSYGVANEEDEEQVEYLPGQEPSGIEKLFNKVQNIPGAVRSGLLSLIGKVNPALSFIGGGLSSIINLPKFFQERRDAKARAEAAERGAAKQQEMARQTAFQAMRGNDAYGGGGGRPGGFGQGAGDFSASDPTATEGSF